MKPFLWWFWLQPLPTKARVIFQGTFEPSDKIFLKFCCFKLVYGFNTISLFYIYLMWRFNHCWNKNFLEIAEISQRDSVRGSSEKYEFVLNPATIKILVWLWYVTHVRFYRRIQYRTQSTIYRLQTPPPPPGGWGTKYHRLFALKKWLTFKIKQKYSRQPRLPIFWFKTRDWCYMQVRGLMNGWGVSPWYTGNVSTVKVL